MIAEMGNISSNILLHRPSAASEGIWLATGKREESKGLTLPSPQSGRNVDPAGLERLRREAREITALYNLGVTVNSSLNLEEVLWSLYKEGSQLINMTNLAIALYDDQNDALEFKLVFERGQRVKSQRARLAGNTELISRILKTRAPLLLADVPENIPASPGFPPRQVRSLLGVPILNQERAQGVIVIWSYEPNTFTEHDLWLLSAIGTQAAIAIRNARLYESVLAERDRVLEAKEQARKQLAYDLHDGPAQLVSALVMRMDFCQMALERNPALVREELADVQMLARKAAHQLRTLLFELRPLALETRGLTEALQIFLERRQ
jgi:signal transduction histidine kinase